MKTAKTFLFVLLTLLLLGCGKELCEGFPDELTAYFPYTTGQTIVFTNEYNGSLSFTVDDYYKTQDYL